MQFYRHIVLFFSLSTGLCFLLLLADYYLLVHFQGTLGGNWVKVLTTYERFVPLTRLLFLISYYCLLLASFHVKRYTGPQNFHYRSNRWIDLSAFGILLVASVLFIMAEQIEITPSSAYYKFEYPISFFVILISMPFARFLFFLKKRRLFSLVRRRKHANADSINFKTDYGWVNLVDPFRHTVVIGGTGSGKSESIVRPMMKQFIEKGYCGILYDYAYPTLANELNTFLIKREDKCSIPLYILNFEDIALCHRVNPIHPDYLKNINYAEEVAASIYYNLDINAAKRGDKFFTQSAINWFTALIWFYKEKYPGQCTLPHVFNTILYEDFRHVFSMLISHPVCADYVRSIVTSLEEEAEKQLAGQVASLQNIVAKLNTPELNWILTGNDFTLDINNPDHPKLLVIGNSAPIRKSLAPVIGCIFTVAFQQMNIPGRKKSFVLLDEAPSIYLDDLAHLGAVARKNKIAIVYIAQDTSMMVDKYGSEQTKSIISNMNNKFFGRISLPDTAKMVGETIGTEEREMIAKSEGKAYNKYSHMNVNTNFSVQERPVVRTQELMSFRQGEFIGRTTDESQYYFWSRFKWNRLNKMYGVGSFISFAEKETGEEIKQLDALLNSHSRQIKAEVNTILKSYRNIY